jgi:hypothetical protein
MPGDRQGGGEQRVLINGAYLEEVTAMVRKQSSMRGTANWLGAAGFDGLKALLLAVALSVTPGSPASAVETVTFEELSPDGPGTGGVIPVLNFYAAKGVIFNAVAIDYSKGIAIPGFAHSGTKAVETCFATEFCSAPIDISFTQAQARVKLWAGFSARLDQSITVVMRAFASDGSQVGQASAILGPNPAPTSIQTPLEISTTAAMITRVTAGIESGGTVSFTNGLAIDDVEFDTVGPPPVCVATQDPTVVIAQPTNGQTVQFNQFILAFRVVTGDPFAVTTVTDTGSGQQNSVKYPGFNRTFGPTWMNGLLVPGPSTLTVAVKDCHGDAQASVNINYSPIAPDERFHVLGFEATQVVQNVPSSVPLVANKPTLVRVYLSATGSTSRVTGVRGTLFAYRPLNGHLDRGPPLQGSVHSSNVISVDTTTDLKAQRLNLGSSLNFELPTDWISEGAVHFELTLDVDGSPSSPVGIPCDGCNNIFFNGMPVFVDFVAMPVFRLRIVGLQYTLPNDHRNPPVLQAPRPLDFGLFQSWVRRAYPAGDFEVSTSTVTSSRAWPFDCNAANAQLSAIRSTEVGNGRDPHTHYVALVINTGGFMRGCASGVPDSPDTSVVASSPTGDTGSGARPINVPGDTDGSFGDWYGGHELAHEFGRKHPGFCNNNSSDDSSFPNPNGQISDNLQTHVGLDKGDALNAVSQKVISPFAFDIMTYCNQPQWFSAYNYLGVLQRLRAENGLPNLSRTPRPAMILAEPSTRVPGEALEGDFVSIVASVNLTRNTGVIRHIDHVRRATVPADQPDQIASVQLRDKGGKVIKSFPTWVRLDTDIPAGQDQTGLVQVTIPVEPSAARVDLLLRGKLLTTRAISAHPPVVKDLRLVAPTTGYGAGGQRILKWVGTDPDGDKLTYMVQISDDRGSWETIAVGLQQTQLVLTDQQLQGRPYRRVRVIANDGYNVSPPATIELGSAN